MIKLDMHIKYYNSRIKQECRDAENLISYWKLSNLALPINISDIYNLCFIFIVLTDFQMIFMWKSHLLHVSGCDISFQFIISLCVFSIDLANKVWICMTLCHWIN